MVREIEIPEIRLPEIPGIAYRKFCGEADYARMVEIKNACHLADGVEEVLSVEELANEYANLKNCDPQTDMLMIEANGELVAQGGIQWRDDDEGNRIFEQEAEVHPAWRHLGLQRVLYEFNEARARQRAAAASGGKPQLMSKWLPASVPEEMALLQTMGYAVVRHFFLMKHDLNPIPYTPMPAGLVLRPVLPEHLRAIWDAKEEAFADHWGHGVRSEEDFRMWRDDPTKEPHLWQVAWDANTNEVAGISINTIYYTDNDHYGFKRGWIDTLGVRRNWRGKGLAKALLANSLRKLHVQGMTEAMLGVDAANPTGALQLYESMGFYRDKESAVWRKPVL
jgi:mycothiol synthase